MKMFKSLLLGSAAGLVAVTTGQAADFPVKAGGGGGVPYAKLCSAYGAGFAYMPGTDMCLKIGGWVRAEVTWGVNGNSTSGIFNNVYNNRYTNNLWTRERGYITADVREQTAYGVARGYLAVGISSQNNGNEAPSTNFSSNRAFVQWAGFTAGLTVSFYDFYPAAALLYRAGQAFSEDTGDGGWWVWAYTAQFGGGVSATLSAEERRTSQILGFSGTSASSSLGTGAAGTTCTAPAGPGASPGLCLTGANTAALGGPAGPGTNGVLPGGAFAAGGGYGGWQAPDVVLNLRVDQAWGGAQVMGALHEVNPSYYGSTPGTGHAGDQWGWVVGGGLKINAPFAGPGDYFITEVNYTQGATKYLNHADSGSNQVVGNGAGEAWGVGSDCVYGGTVAAGNNTGCLLTTAWSVNAAYEHYWSPQWHESFVGAYLAESYGTAANAMLCSGEGFGSGAGTAATATAGCNNNWSFWAAGSRLQWDVTKNFYIGVEALYEQMVTAQTPTGLLSSAIALPNSGATTVSNESNWTFTVRMHKDFLP